MKYVEICLIYDILLVVGRLFNAVLLRSDIKMAIVKRKFDKVIRFYQSLPIELTDVIITKIGNVNRKSQRMLSKYKTLDDKIKFLLQ